MTTNISWKSGDGEQWLHALELPTHAWIRPYLELMDFPVELRKKGLLLLHLSAMAQKQYTALWQANQALGHSPELDSAITREFVTATLADLQAEAGTVAQEDFQAWAYLHFVRKEFAQAFFGWRFLLVPLCRKRDSSVAEAAVFQSSHWQRLLPEICPLINSESYATMKKELPRIAPPSEEERREIGSELSSDALKALEIVRNRLMLTVLAKMKTTLSAQELAEVGLWAAEQARKEGLDPASLLIDQLLAS